MGGIKALILACILVLNQSFVFGNTDQNDVSALNVLYTSFNSPSQLTGWSSANSGDPCGQAWLGVTCAGSSVKSIKLSGMGLTGNLGYNLNNMASLTELDLSNNNLGGGQQIPYNLPPNLERFNLAGNQFNGNLPYSISYMVTLKYLILGHNQLQGNLTDIFYKLTNLTTMDLSFNSLTGDLPQSFSSLTSLNTLYVQNNQFTGTIDVLAALPLEDLNVESNRFTGWIPDRLQKINNLQTGGNSWSSGPAPPPPPYTPPPPGRKVNPGQNSNSGNNPSSGGGSGGGGSSEKLEREQNPEQKQPFAPFAPFASNGEKEMKLTQTVSILDNSALPPAAPISLKPPPKIHKSFDENDTSNKPVAKKTDLAPIKATVYSIADLQMATNSFSVDNLVGEGSFGRVYRAEFDDEKVLAVKKINFNALPNSSSGDFIELVSNISCLHHPNLSELVGYCNEHGQHLLVYEFHGNGSLHDFLHLPDDYNKPLSWNQRVKISLGSARALEYLHEVCSPSIIHKHFKSSNILLDMELNPHVSDSGLASLVPNPEFQASDENSGYTAPEVSMSGQYSLKSDIYSFGVVMLELLTGRKPFDGSRPRSEQSLVRWATPQLHDIDALDRMVDPALQGLYPAKSLSRFADVIALCVQPEPEFRPPMSEVVQALVRLVQRPT
uniref:Protein kinase domain-containing protein n=1 Tax=Ananas comosus var. bracteatus TaxID=296719 RepID=A0A6V7PN43_ANACO|nr:unnamed protein product [Ananas comosus var. bracteatus]